MGDYKPTEQVLAAGRSSLGNLFLERARMQPDTLAVEEDGVLTTYGDLATRVLKLANALKGQGVERGDRIGLLCHNRREYLEGELAAALIGAITACLNWRLVGAELSHCVTLVTPKLMICDPEQAARLDELDIPDIPRLILGEDYETVLEAADDTNDHPLVDPEEGLVILYTSGTTGLPKGALISHRAMIARALVFASELHLAYDDHFVAWAPFFHMASTDHALATILRGGAVIVVDGYQPAPLIDAAERYKVGWFVVIPGMIEDFINHLNAKPFRPKGIRFIGAMADLVPPHQLVEVTRLLDAPFFNSFGSTETGVLPGSRSMVEIGVPPVRLSKIQGAFCEVRLVDADENEVGIGEPGDLAIRGATVFSGYWNAPETNAEDFRHGWFHNGDVFRRNADGTIDFLDRAKYMIKSGGENVYPAEIERVLLSDPHVQDAAVVKAPDNKWGESPVAFVATDDASVTETTLMALCRQELAGYKRPREIHFIGIDDFPRSTSGKVQRHELEARYREGK